MNLKLSTNLWLDAVPLGLRDQARSAFRDGNMILFLISAGNDRGLELVFRNIIPLREQGSYETALLEAFISCRVNNHHDYNLLRWMFEHADRTRLRALAPLPGPGPFLLYRGVAGNGRARRIRGLSWTADEKRAWWFARRFYLNNPSVFSALVDEEHLLAYSNGRQEQEFIVMLPHRYKVKKLDGTGNCAAL